MANDLVAAITPSGGSARGSLTTAIPLLGRVAASASLVAQTPNIQTTYMASVNIIVKDNQVIPAPVQGVTVNVYDPAASYAFLANALTDANGQAAFILPGATPPGKVYEVRFYKMGVIFPNPSQIMVIDPLGVGQTNNFTVLATGMPSVLPVASDPRCCRCTGVFVDYQNRPLRQMLVRFYQNPEAGFEVPKVLDGNMVAAESFEIYTDVNGKMSIDLIRGGEFNIVFAGEEEVPWNIKVPDKSSVNLIDLIHPQPLVLTWDQAAAPGNSLSLARGQTVKVFFTVLFSDGELNVNLNKWLNITFPDPCPFSAIFEIHTDGTVSLNITGVSAGTAAATVALQAGQFPKRVPDYSLNAPQLNVTVT